jgi:hypothetical protein
LATKDEGEISAKVDILTPEYAELIKAPKAEWEKLLTGKVRQASTEESEQAVFGFKNDKAASFDTLRLFIKETNQYNIKKLEIFTSRDSLKGPYQSVGTFEFENIRMIKTGGWQEVTFAPVTAKYFTFKITSYNGSWVDIPEDGDKGKGIQLMGRIIP